MKKLNSNFILENVSDIEIIQQMYGNHNCAFSSNRCIKRYYFRGQSNSDWGITPSIYRDKKDNENTHEPILKSGNLFEEIAKLQHDGIHTRFVDFTTELNIALYFACDGNFEKDGKIFICTYFDAPSELSKYTKIISSLTQITTDISVKDFCDKYGFNDNEKPILLAFLETGFMVEPSEDFYGKIKFTNSKMYKQHGCFYIPSNKSNYYEYKSRSHLLYDDMSSLIINPEISLNWLLDNSQSNNYVVIPKEFKSQILEYLKNKNITKKSLGLEDTNE